MKKDLVRMIGLLVLFVGIVIQNAAIGDVYAVTKQLDVTDCDLVQRLIKKDVSAEENCCDEFELWVSYYACDTSWNEVRLKGLPYNLLRIIEAVGGNVDKGVNLLYFTVAYGDISMVRMALINMDLSNETQVAALLALHKFVFAASDAEAATYCEKFVLISDSINSGDAVASSQNLARFIESLWMAESLQENTKEWSMDRCEQVVEWMQKHGVDINAPYEADYRLLMSAVKNGSVKIVKLLLNCGANPNLENEYGETALMLAAVYGSMECMKELLDRGAQLNYENRDGMTALMVEAQLGRSWVVKMLLDSGADINYESSRGDTVLRIAVRMGQTGIVRMLLDRGADPGDWNEEAPQMPEWCWGPPNSARVRRMKRGRAHARNKISCMKTVAEARNKRGEQQ